MNNIPNAVRVTITPDMAMQFLEKNTKNRSLKRMHLSFLCNELEAGRWKFNGDAIRIAKDGSLIDGQHRLEAVKTTGVPIDTLLVTGLDSDVFDTIDGGAKRSAGDTLTVAGEKNGRNLAAALIIANDLLSGKTDFTRTTKTSNAELLNMLDRNPHIRDSISWGNNLSRLSPPSISVAMHYLFSRNNPKKADEFFNSLASGAGLEIDSPVLLLRQRLIDNATAKGKLTRRYMTALFIKSWNAHLSGKKIKNLRFREIGDCPESFPAIK